MPVKAKKKSTQKMWVYSPNAPSPPKASDTFKAEALRKVQELIDTKLKALHIQLPPENPQFNHKVDVFCLWNRNCIYVKAKYACPHPTAIAPFFDSNIARLKYLGGDQFDMDYQRHNDQWMTIHHSLTLAQCLVALIEDPWFEAN